MSRHMIAGVIAICLTVSNALAAAEATTQSEKDKPAEVSTEPQNDDQAGATTTATAAAIAPASAPAGAEMAEVVSVSGSAQKRLPGEDQKWQPLEVGELLDLRTIIRTGLGAEVVLMFGDRSKVTIANATKVGIGQFSKRDGLVSIHLGLKYGAIRASVDSSRGPNDFQVKTPVATLSIRGSEKQGSYFVDVGAKAIGHKGRVGVRTPAGFQLLRPGESSTHRRRLPIYRKIFLFNALLGPLSGGLGEDEFWKHMGNSDGRGVFSGYMPTSTGPSMTSRLIIRGTLGASSEPMNPGHP